MSCKHKAFRALRGLLSCVDKKVTKETTPVGPSSALCADDPQACRAFPEGTSMYRPETSRIVRAALRVFAPPACRASTGEEGQDQKHLPLHSETKVTNHQKETPAIIRPAQ
ncbi:MAG: hypothetical protein KA738_10240 [Pseudoxanthomonas sp.]|nr:hypothetical protein [Pseudoxanthomonas sp.]